MAEVRASTVRLNEGIQVQEARSCLLCANEGVSIYQGLRDRLFGAPGIWSLMRCQKCHLVWLNPRPVPEDIGKLYEHYFTHNTPDSTSLAGGDRGFAYSLMKSCLERFLSLIRLSQEMAELDTMTLNKHIRGKLLDIGCGNGQFLAKMRELGWEVIGVESDSQAVKVARECFGLDVHEGTLEETDFPDDTFDAVTMHHVIEHVWDPISTLQECCRVLKSSGKLVVVTPNIESLGHQLFVESWRGLEVPRHLYLFSPHTLRACAERAGLRVLQLRTTARSARWMWAASHLIKQNGVLPGGSPQKQGLWLRLEGLAFQVVEHGLCTVRDAGEEIVLIATK